MVSAQKVSAQKVSGHKVSKNDNMGQKDSSQKVSAQKVSSHKVSKFDTTNMFLRNIYRSISKHVISAWPDGERRAFWGDQMGRVNERYFDLESVFNKYR